jgi:hypothetical protein
MTWKEQFDESVRGIADKEVRDGKWLVERDEVIDFISTQIIKKLIEDIPDRGQCLAHGKDNTIIPMLVLKQQLRDKWL